MFVVARAHLLSEEECIPVMLSKRLNVPRRWFVLGYPWDRLCSDGGIGLGRPRGFGGVGCILGGWSKLALCFAVVRVVGM